MKHSCLYRRIPMICVTVFGLVLSFILPSSAAGGDWPQWRGPAGTGVSSEKNFPISWSSTVNVLWKVALPAEGNSSPIVVGGRVFLTCPFNKGRQRILICFDRTDGNELWRRVVEYDQTEATHGTNPQASSSPASDGERIVVWYGSAGLYCYDLDGKQLWQRDVGQFDHIWGYGSSPVFVGDSIILNAGPGTVSFVAAYNKVTGEPVWKKDYDGMKSTKPDEYRGSWSTPVLSQSGDDQLLLLSLPLQLRAVNPANGNDVWSCAGLTNLVYTSPIIAGDKVVAMGGYHGATIACRMGGRGDVTASHRLWIHEKRNPQRIGSGVATDNHVYILNENGVGWCLDAATGEKTWEQRIGHGTSWGSMCLVDGRIYVQNMKGDVIVLQENPRSCEILSENTLHEGSRSSPAFSNGNIFIRTFKHLYCIGQKPSTK